MELVILIVLLMVPAMAAAMWMRERQARRLAESETSLIRGHLRDLRQSLAASNELVRMQGEQLAALEVHARLGEWRRDHEPDLTPVQPERQMPPVRVSFQPEA